MRCGFKKGILILVAIIMSLSSVPIWALDKYSSKVTYTGSTDVFGTYKSTRFDDVHDGSADIMKIASLGIMKGHDRNFYPERTISKQEAVVALVKLKGLSINGFKEKSDKKAKYSPWADKYLQAAAADGIIPKDAVKKLDFMKPVTKEEFIYWLACALKEKPATKYTVMDMLKDSTKINREYKPYIETILIKGVMWNTSESYFNPQSNFTRGKMASVMSTALGIYKNKLAYKSVYGQVADMVQKNVTAGSTKSKASEYYVQMDDGYFFKLKAGSTNKILTDFLVYKDKTLGYSSKLKKGDYVECLVKGTKIAYIDAYKSGTYESQIEGEIDSINGDTITIKLDDVNYRIVNISGFTQVYMNNTPAKASELLVGQDVVVKVRGNYAQTIDGYPQQDGKEESTQRIFGIVEDLSEGKLLLDVSGEKKEYNIADYTNVYKNGKATDLYSIKQGDIVRIVVDGKLNIEEISIQGYGGEVKNVIKGKMLGFDGAKRAITITGVNILENGKWNLTYGQQDYDLDVDCEIYCNGQLVPEEDLGKYLGKEVYAATISNSGEEVIAKANIKLGIETVLNDRLKDVNTAMGRVRTGSGNNLTIDKGTIIIYNNQLGNEDFLLNNLSAFFGIDQRNNGNYADVIAMVKPQINNILDNYQLYMGRLDKFSDNYVELGAVSQFTNNSWASKGKTVKVNLNTDAEIYDSQLKTYLTPKELISGSYMIDPASNPGNIYSWYAYVITDKNGNLKGMYLTPKASNLMSERLKTGVFKSSRDDSRIGKIITVANTKEWSYLNLTWRNVLGKEDVIVNSGFVFKDGDLTDIDSLEENDELFYIIDGSNVYIFAK